MEETIKLHKFEAAGLGQAPYRLKGISREIFQAVPGDPSCPIQPGTCCDYCGIGIMDTFWLESADGKRFKVGCDCIYKMGDKGLTAQVAPAKRKLEREKREARKAAKIAAQAAHNTSAPVAIAMLERLDALEADPHASHFARHFAADVARRLRSGRAAEVSERQLALLEKLESEAAA